MRFDLYPYQTPFHLGINLQVFSPVKIRLSFFDPETGRIYLERISHLKKDRKLLLKFPIVPNKLRGEIKGLSIEGENAFSVDEIKAFKDSKCPLNLTEGDKKFIRFAKWFSIHASTLSSCEKGFIYDYEGFRIIYFDRFFENGVELSTPARIARRTGVIEISKKAIRDYTVPMLIVMLLHEYAHKFKNPQYGKKITNELTADLIAIHIALNLGFDAFEVENCFRKVFAKKDTKLNRKRMGAIVEFITVFKKSENQRCSVK